uniref:Uncharacterized protein n=1 Tax=Tetraselmis sp. GSL018 TaxID=582737 RepID=A0A061S775_9CHLO
MGAAAGKPALHVEACTVCNQELPKRSVSESKLLEEFLQLPSTIRQSLASVDKFNPQAFTEATRQPVATLAFLAAKSLADSASCDSNALARLLRIVNAHADNENSAQLAHRLSALQFLHVQLCSGGALENFSKDFPLQCMGMIIAAAMRGLETLAETGMRMISKEHRRRVQRTELILQGYAIIIVRSGICQGLDKYKQNVLVRSVVEALRTSNPFMLSALFRKHDVLLAADWQTTVVQISTVVCQFSYLLRPFKQQVEWLKSAIVARAGATTSSLLLSKFSFKEAADVHSELFARSCSWFIEKVVLPYIYLWENLLTVSTSCKYRVSVIHTKNNFEMFCDDNVVDPERAHWRRKDGDPQLVLSKTPLGECLDNLSLDFELVLSMCTLFQVPVLEELFACARQQRQFIVQESLKRS